MSRRCVLATVASLQFICLSGFAQSVGHIVVLGDFELPSLISPDSVMAVSAGSLESLALLADGSLVSWGVPWAPMPDPTSSYRAISAGYSHNLALRSDSTVVAWGSNVAGESDSPQPNQDFVAISSCFHHSLALRSDGSVAAWGMNVEGQCSVPEPNADFVAVDGGDNFSIGLKADGSLVAWGSNTFGQCDIPEPNSNFTALSAGPDFVVALRADSSLVAWGRNLYGACTLPTPNEDFIAVSAGWTHCLALRADSSLAAWGGNFSGQCELQGANQSFLKLSAGYGHSLAIQRSLHTSALLEPDSLVFAPSLVHGSRSASFTLTNTGDLLLADTLRIPDAVFQLQDSPEFSLASGESRTFELMFQSDQAGYFSSQLELGSVVGSLPCRASAHEVLMQVGPESECGTIDNPGNEPDATSGFLVDWNDGLIGLDVVPPPAQDLQAEIWIMGQIAWTGSTSSLQDAAAALDTLEIWLENDMEMHIEVRNGDQVWNENGALCDWTLELTGQQTPLRPGSLSLDAPVPNPFNPSTTLAYTLPVDGFVSLDLFNIQGALVRELVAQTLPAGRHSVIVDGSALASGLYLARLQTAQGVRSTRLLLLK